MPATGGIRCLVLLSFHVSVFLLLHCRLSLGDVIIGELLHNSSYRKRITLRNTGGKSENLSQYTLVVRVNTRMATRYRLEPISADAILEPNSTFTICHPRGFESCDVMWEGLRYNGDDYVALLENDAVVDAIGEEDEEGVVSGRWTVGGREIASRYYVLLRRENITRGNTDWIAAAQSEWQVQYLEEEPTTSSSPATEIDDSCWSIRNQLETPSLDACRAPVEQDSVIIGTYNTQFLFDGVSDPRPQDVWQSVQAAERHVEDIADVIRRNAPDILALQEVEDESILMDLVESIDDPVYIPHFVQGRDTATGQDVGLLTQTDSVRNVTRTNCRSGRVPGSGCTSSFNDTRGISKNMIALFDSCLFGTKFALIVVHLYAFPSSSLRCVWRESQARIIQDVVQQLMAAEFEVIITGDVNDYSDLHEDVQSSEPISRVLSMLRDPDGDGNDELDNVMSFLPMRERYTSWWDQDEDDVYEGVTETTQIDHILMTKGLSRRINRVWIDHEANPEIVSDHWPLFVEVET